jgi:hypothetical protein
MLLEFRITNYELRIKLLKRTIFLALFFILYSLFYPSPAFAQDSTPSATILPTTNYQLPTNIPPTSPAYTDLFVHNMFHTFSCFSVGSSIIGQPCLTYQITQNAQGAIESVPVLSEVNLGGGALGTTASLIGLLYTNPPIRTADYLASLGKGFGIVKEARAQGVVGSGNAVLSPILTLWQVSRNIAYIIMIIIFVIIGLMVMFRQRINPQTVITAQAALPGLVIGLILITFSYFLAALITDTAFIGTNLVGYYFVAAQEGATQENLVEKTANENVLTIMGKVMNGIGKDPITDGIGAFFNSLVDPASRFVRAGAALAAYQVGSSIGPALGAIAALTICGVAALPIVPVTLPTGIGTLGLAGGAALCAQAGSAIGGAVVGSGLAAATAINPPAMIGYGLWFIALIIIIYSMFRLLMRLINNFLSIIFLVITAPFHFLAASLPGRQEIATAWVLNMLCNILAFPAVMGVFYFVNYLLGSQDISQSPFQITSAEGIAITGSNTLPLFGGLNIFVIKILLAFGALVTTPAIPDIICRTIGRVGVAGQLIGQEIGAGIGGGQRYFGQAQGAFGGIQRDVAGFGQIPGQRTIQTEIDPATGQAIGPARELLTPGLWRRIRGR